MLRVNSVQSCRSRTQCAVCAACVSDCTRCIRFTTEVAGVTTMGATGRGQIMEIGTYVDKLLDTELSGNVIDLWSVQSTCIGPPSLLMAVSTLTSCVLVSSVVFP